MPTIKKTIESIYDKVDDIFAIDGKFYDFPQLGDCDYSTDGTLEFLETLDKVALTIACNLSEVDKRNLYLTGQTGDWYLHLDADEEWLGDIDIPEQHDMLIHWLQRRNQKQYMKRIRLFRHIDGIHYHKKHYWLHDRMGQTFCLLDKPGRNYSAKVSKQVKIRHNEHDRDEYRVGAKKHYYKALCKIEARYMEDI